MYAVALLDELASGVPSAGAPDIRRTFGLSYAGTTAVVFLVPALVGLVVDPVVYLLADRYPRQWFVVGGLAAMGFASFGAALAPGPVLLGVALAVWYVASGAACSIAQATLVDRAPGRRGQTMARWTLWSSIGDLVAPALLATLAAAGFGWRAAFASVGAVLAVWAMWLAKRFAEADRNDLASRSARDVAPDPVASGVPSDGATAAPFPRGLTAGAGSESVADATPAQVSDADPETVPLRRALREAFADRTLLAWLFGAALCDLLDEILVVFASLHVRDELGASATWQGLVIGAFSVGSTVGLVVLERMLARRDERRVLFVACLGCAVTYAAWLFAPTLWMSVAGALLVGALAAPLYPLAAAQAYARCPGRSGLVLAAGHVFTPLGLALPVVLGAVADGAGTLAALALLLAQPVGLAWLARPRSR